MASVPKMDPNAHILYLTWSNTKSVWAHSSNSQRGHWLKSQRKIFHKLRMPIRRETIKKKVMPALHQATRTKARFPEHTLPPHPSTSPNFGMIVWMLHQRPWHDRVEAEATRASARLFLPLSERTISHLARRIFTNCVWFGPFDAFGHLHGWDDQEKSKQHP